MLMMETLRTAPPPPGPKPDADPPWSMSWIQARMDKRDGNTRSHVPKHLNGRARTPTTKDKPKWSALP
jgi:hypothetical protein